MIYLLKNYFFKFIIFLFFLDPDMPKSPEYNQEGLRNPKE